MMIVVCLSSPIARDRCFLLLEISIDQKSQLYVCTVLTFQIRLQPPFILPNLLHFTAFSSDSLDRLNIP